MSTKYHGQLSALEHYRKYPSMLPFIGCAYESTSHKKLLLCGESHYLPKDSKANIDHERWYAGNEATLTKDEIRYIHTADTLTYSGHRMYEQLFSALAEAGSFQNNAKDHCAYMNLFLRPASAHDSIKSTCKKIDKTEAYGNICKVVEILKPDVMVICSKTACLAVEEFKFWNHTEKHGCKYTYVNHPTCRWWNDTTNEKYFKGRTSREHMVAYLKENWIK